MAPMDGPASGHRGPHSLRLRCCWPRDTKDWAGSWPLGSQPKQGPCLAEAETGRPKARPGLPGGGESVSSCQPGTPGSAACDCAPLVPRLPELGGWVYHPRRVKWPKAGLTAAQRGWTREAGDAGGPPWRMQRGRGCGGSPRPESPGHARSPGRGRRGARSAGPGGGLRGAHSPGGGGGASRPAGPEGSWVPGRPRLVSPPQARTAESARGEAGRALRIGGGASAHWPCRGRGLEAPPLPRDWARGWAGDTWGPR